MSLILNQDKFRSAVLELIRRTSTDLSPDVVTAIAEARDSEEENSGARGVLTAILKNIDRAREKSTPICQDTGTNIYYITIPEGFSMRRVSEIVYSATREATEKGYLRPNAVDPVTGKNSGDNTGFMSPDIHFEEWDEPAIRVRLILKGGGCENVSVQYTLPDTSLNAGRDLEGVYRCVLDAVVMAQGKGCAPGILGVGVGGDRSTGTITAKKQLLRKLDDVNSDPELARLESRLLADLNTLGIGPMGFGGKTTALAVKLGKAHRLPASFFVSVSYMCWADRRKSMTFSCSEVIYD